MVVVVVVIVVVVVDVVVVVVVVVTACENMHVTWTMAVTGRAVLLQVGFG